jgi:hypothetical protein
MRSCTSAQLKCLAALVYGLLIGFGQTSFAQQLYPKQTLIPVNGYELAKMGYPSRLVAGAAGSALYVEFWQGGEGRKLPNHYIQCVNKEYEEMWFKPITKDGTPRMTFMDIYHLNGSAAVLGQMPDAATKGEKTVVQFFNFDGVEMGPLQTVSGYTERMKDFKDFITLSPSEDKMLWLGTNPSETPRNRRYFCSVFNKEGRMEWRRELVLPKIGDKYAAKQVIIDNRGILFFLIANQNPTGTLADTTLPPRILRYDPATKIFADLPLQFGAVAQEVAIGFANPNTLSVVALTSNGSQTGLPNGAKLGLPNRIWRYVALQQFDLQKNMAEVSNDFWPIPDTVVKRYVRAAGAGFQNGDLHSIDGQLLWVWEEKYQQESPRGKQTVFGDLLLFSFGKVTSVGTPPLQWTGCVPKTQRDLGAGNLLSVSNPVGNDQFFYFFHITKIGAGGTVASINVNRKTGEHQLHDLAPNDNSDFYFFPKRGAVIEPRTLMMLGAGEPGKNNYKLFQLKY